MTQRTLESVYAAFWRELETAFVDRSHPWRTPVVATLGEDGPDARVVVLRAVDRHQGTLDFYTDARSAKVDQLRICARVVWVFCDLDKGLELRARARAVVHVNDDWTDRAWATTPPASRRLYAAPCMPGAVLSSPAENVPTGDKEQERRNFALVHTVVEEFDWLFLGTPGHERARFTRTVDGWHKTWIAP